MVGVISNMVVAKGFGFISADNGQEYFFHRSEVITEWDYLLSKFNEKGGRKVSVTFEPAKTPKGPRARNVTVIQED